MNFAKEYNTKRAALNLNPEQEQAMLLMEDMIDEGITNNLNTGEYSTDMRDDQLLLDVVDEQLDVLEYGMENTSLRDLRETRFDDLFAVLSYGYFTTAELVRSFEGIEEDDEDEEIDDPAEDGIEDIDVVDISLNEFHKGRQVLAHV